ncbi:MAG: DUF6502 family protein [Cocleimonas sp.]
MQNKTEKTKTIMYFPALIKAVRRMLYPLIHMLLKTGITFPQLAELLKEVYVDVADKNFQIDNKTQTQTRLSFLTGIHRKDIKRLHKQNTDILEPENISVGVQLVSKWIQQPRYLDENKKPLVLPLKAKGEPSFEELVATVCKQDIRSRVILDEWLNLGVVTLNNNKVQLITDAFIAKDGLAEKAFFVGHNIADHLSAVSQNLLSDDPVFFERCVYYDDLSDESINELKKLVEEQGMNTLKVINQRASELKRKDKEKHRGKQRINIGLYLYHEENSKDKET